MCQGRVTPQKILHLVKLEELTYQMSQEGKCATKLLATAHLAHFVTYGRAYITMALPRLLIFGDMANA